MKTQAKPPFVMRKYSSGMTGALVAKCPNCGMVCAYWEQDDLDDNGNLLCYCEDTKPNPNASTVATFPKGRWV